MHIYRVFCNQDGNHGNPVGVIFDLEQKLSTEQRQEISTESGFSECVFVNSLDVCSVNIFSPQREVPFAGHAVLGTVFAINDKYNLTPKFLKGIAGDIAVWKENDLTWVRSELQNTPAWWHEKVESVEVLETLDGPQSHNQTHTQLWAWIDETSGLVRARTFAPAWGIPEDEANGSGSMRLAATLDKKLKIIHGKGSVIYARHTSPGTAEVGGQVTFEKSISL